MLYNTTRVLDTLKVKIKGTSRFKNYVQCCDKNSLSVAETT